MKTTITETQFKDSFNAIRPNSFSYAGLSALFDYFEDYEESCVTEIEFDVISICCDFSEYDSAEECLRDYMTADQFADQFADIEQDDIEEECLDYLRENTSVIEFSGGVIIAAF